MSYPKCNTGRNGRLDSDQYAIATPPLATIWTALISAVAMVAVVCSAVAAVPTVDNGPEPRDGLREVKLTELWRAGGEDDEIFFGYVAAVRTDAAGRLYILDQQQSEVQIYATDGTHLRTVGREGEGPGEFRSPNDMFVLPDGTVCVLQGFPGNIVKLAPDGTPAGQSTFNTGGGTEQGQFGVLVAGRAVGNGIALAGIQMTIGGAVSEQTYFLSRCSVDGVQTALLLEKKHVIDYSDFRLDEQKMDFVWNRFAIGPEGRIYLAPERNVYSVQVFAPDGELERVIRREYSPITRTAEQSDVQRRTIEGVGAYYPVPPREITIEPTAPDIAGMFVDDRRQLWVISSLGVRDRAAGVFVVADVFDPDGGFVEQVALLAPGDPERDSFYLLGDGRVVVVTGALDAFLNQQAVAADETAEEAEPLEVICYRGQ